MPRAMMNKLGISMLWGALSLAACGDDKSTSADNGNTSGIDDTGDAGSPKSCVTGLVPVTGAMATSVKPVYTCDAKPSSKMADSQNACRNDSDCEIIDSDMVREIARVCALSCRSYTECDELDACNKKCVADTTAMKVKAPGLSGACSSCYARIAGCALEKCLSECSANADSPECVKCSFTSGCRIPFEECSGLDRN